MLVQLTVISKLDSPFTLDDIRLSLDSDERCKIEIDEIIYDNSQLSTLAPFWFSREIHTTPNPTLRFFSEDQQAVDIDMLSQYTRKLQYMVNLNYTDDEILNSIDAFYNSLYIKESLFTLLPEIRQEIRNKEINKILGQF